MIDLLGVKSDEILYVGDGGSKELYEPHIPCPILNEFPHADKQSEILNYVEYP